VTRQRDRLEFETAPAVESDTLCELLGAQREAMGGAAAPEPFAGLKYVRCLTHQRPVDRDVGRKVMLDPATEGRVGSPAFGTGRLPAGLFVVWATRDSRKEIRVHAAESRGSDQLESVRGFSA
jgi:hypothetical protein